MKTISKYYWIPFVALLLQACGGGTKTILGRQGSEKTVPFDAYISETAKKRADVKGRVKSVTFQITETSEKDTASFAEWFKNKGLSLQAMVYHDEPSMQCLSDFKVVDWAKKYLKHEANNRTYFLSHVVQQEGYVLFFYGNPPDALHIVTNISLLVVRDVNTEALRYSLEFTPYGMAPEYIARDKDYVFQSARWAFIEAGVLYIEHAHWRYSESSKGKNAYISAIDLQRNELLWRSQPLVANAVNFVMMEDIILCGYGYTREGAKVYALDKQTGEVVGQLELCQPDALEKKHIEYLMLKGSTLYAKLFDGTEYSIAIRR